MNLKEIAKAAGVSQSAVTIVLHNRKGVSRETYEKVKKLLDENGYQIKTNDRVSVIHGSQKKIMFIKYKRSSSMIDGNPDYINQVIDEVGKHCSLNDYELIFTVANPDTVRAVIEKVNNEAYEGIILLGTEFLDEDRDLLKMVKKPIVIVDNDLVRLPITSVSNHTWNSMRTKVEYLVSRGHREIGYLKNTRPTSICDQCFKGFLNALKEFDLPVLEKYYFDIEPTTNGAYNSMKHLLDKGITLPPALICNSDSMTIGAMKAFQEYGIKIPKNLSLVSGDNIPACTFSNPPLTSADTHITEIGKWAVKLLLEQIKNPNAPIIRLRIESTLIKRESVCDYVDYMPYV